jgi:hypothetical protein
MANLVGPKGQLFGEAAVTPDATTFQVPNTSADYYDSAYYSVMQGMVQQVPRPRTPPEMQLADVVGADLVAQITAAGRITFHSVGDTGAEAMKHIKTQDSIADAIAADQKADPLLAFLYHLGDLVYDFGEPEYWYDQFYEPFRNYDRPIFAIPGNHDGLPKFGTDPLKPLYTPLFSFRNNMCTTKPQHSTDAGALVRTTMTQPGAYFTLHAPFVSIIGLYTNTLEGPGVISSQSGMFEQLDDSQVDFLTEQLTALAPQRRARERAVIVACHHPPASADTKSGGSTALSNDIDRACKAANFLPDAVLSGHAHLYQRFTRATAGRTIPYIVAGSGGHNVSMPLGELANAQYPVTWGEFTLEQPPQLEYGYLTVTVDMKDAAGPSLAFQFTAPANTAANDHAVVDLASGSLR